ncbi:MAG: NAD(P)/FAD-dependent oxidoreductase, partial [Steroidobacteraceae bacterium]
PRTASKAAQGTGWSILDDDYTPNLVRIACRFTVTALEGGEHLESVTIRNAEAGQSRKVAARALFIMVGAAPNTEWLSGLVKLDDKGFVVTGLGVPGSPFATSYPGIFAVGDVRAGSVKRVASAVGEGSVVISKVWEHVKQNTT